MSEQLRRLWRVRQDKYDGLWYPEYWRIGEQRPAWARPILAHRRNHAGYRTRAGAMRYVETGPQFGITEAWCNAEYGEAAS